MMSHTRRAEQYWRVISEQLLGAAVIGVVGIVALQDTGAALGSLPIASLVIGSVLGGATVAMIYVKRLEQLYDYVPTILLMIIAGGAIMFFLTGKFLAGLTLSYSGAIVASLLAGELVMLAK